MSGLLSTSSIDPLDLINFTKDLAQVNATYLTISVGIMVFLGGVFVYFNIKPLQDILNKQEKNIEDLESRLIKSIDDHNNKTKQTLNDLVRDVKADVSLEIGKVNDRVDFQIAEFRDKLSSIESRFAAESSRALALISLQQKNETISFYWHIKAAYNFSNIENNNLAKTFINRAKELIEDVKRNNSIDKTFLNESDRVVEIKDYFSRLKNISEEKIIEIEKIFNDVIR